MPRQATLFRFEATTVRTGTHVEKDACVRIVANYPADAYLSAEKDDVDHVSREKSHAFAHVRVRVLYRYFRLPQNQFSTLFFG
jgi:hypothetical protein